MKSIVLAAAGWWVALFAIYLLLVAGSLSAEEAVAGGGVALVAAVALSVVRAHSGVSYTMRAAWWKPLATVPWSALRDCAVVLGAICGRPLQTSAGGHFIEREMDPGSHDIESKSRRALVLAAVSLPPNSFVLTIDRERRRLLLHELVPQDNSTPNQEWPL